MLELTVSVPEIRELINDVAENPWKIFELVRCNVRESVGTFLSNLMDAQLTLFLGRERYERKQGAANRRNGSYQRRFTLRGLGEVTVLVPRDRQGEFKQTVLPQYRQYEESIRQDLAAMFLGGLSTRCLSLISNRLLGRRLSHQEVSKAAREMLVAIEQWRTRDLSIEPIKYIFVDGTNFHMRIEKKIERVPVLVAIGVTSTGHKKVLGFQAGDKESASTWREFFKDLKARGLRADVIQLGIMDGLPGLEKVFESEFPRAKVQRCQVHVAANVLAKVPRAQKQRVADDMRSIFYAPSKAKADELYAAFKERWEKDLPSATACLARHIKPCLTFFSFPEAEWVSLRTTNIIERLNKEFKRRTKPMEIVAGENSCYLLLAFVAARMEVHWRANPVGRLHANLPFFTKRLHEKRAQPC